MTRSSCGGAGRDGMVLLFALLCLIAIEVTAVGMHFVALQELRSGRAVARATQLRLAAQSAASRALREWPPDGLQSLAAMDSLAVPPAAGTAPGGITFSATVMRLGDDLFLVRAAARSPLLETSAVGALVALAKAEDLAAAAEAAVSAGGVVTVTTGGVISAGEPCAPGGSAAESAVVIGTADALHADAGSIEGPVRIAAGVTLPGGVGGVPRPVLERASLPITTAALTPSPSILDDCSTDPSNWGDPADGTAACAAYFPILRRAGDLQLNDGAGQGILLVDGDLQVAATRFDGIVMVRGDVALDAGAVINGVVIAGGNVTLTRGAHVDFDRCAVAESLRDVRVRGPFRPVGRTWIPLF